MVLLASSRSLARSLGPLASRSRAFQSSAASRSLSTATARGQAKSTTLLRPAAATRTSSLLSTGSSFRMLTTQREKVKVLLVLYDGGQHAKDVSVNFPIGYPSLVFYFLFLFFLLSYIPPRRSMIAGLLTPPAADCLTHPLNPLQRLQCQSAQPWLRVQTVGCLYCNAYMVCLAC